MTHGAPSRLLVAALLLAAAACGDTPTAAPPAEALALDRPWVVAAPAEVGVDPEALEAAAEAAGRVPAFESLLVVRRGRLVLERYWGEAGPDVLQDVRSVTKSVVSLLAGIALERGEIAGLDQPVTDFLRAPAYPVRLGHGRITVGHLLEMTGGFAWSETGDDVSTYNDWVGSDDPIAYLLDRPLDTGPGTSFTYNSAAVHLLGAVLEEATGRPLPEYADEHLFGPLGIAARSWETFPDGRVNGGSGIDLRPRDLARLGQLVLQDGWSGEESVVPAPWIEASRTRRFGWAVQAGPMARVSYGLLWWLDLDREAVFAEGFRGQFVYVMPSEELVAVATTDRATAVSLGLAAGELRNAVARVLVEDVVGALR